MSEKLSKGEVRERAKAAARHAVERGKVQAERQGIRNDLNTGDQAAWGTSSASMGRVKQESEEAKLAACAECGYSGGRHSRFCAHA